MRPLSYYFCKTSNAISFMESHLLGTCIVFSKHSWVLPSNFMTKYRNSVSCLVPWHSNLLSNIISVVALVVKNPPANVGDIRDADSVPGLGRSSGGGHGNPLQYSCLENPHGQRSLVGYSPWSRKESDTTEQHTTEWLSIHIDVPLNVYTTYF